MMGVNTGAKTPHLRAGVQDARGATHMIAGHLGDRYVCVRLRIVNEILA
jgi:hypothetical protein